MFGGEGKRYKEEKRLNLKEKIIEDDTSCKIKSSLSSGNLKAGL